MVYSAAEMPQLKAAQFQHDPIVGADFVEVVQEAAAEVAAEPSAAAACREDRRGHRRGGRFAVGAGHADRVRRAGLQEQSDFGVDGRPGAAGDFDQRISRPHRRIHHQQFGRGEVLRAMSAEVECGDGRVGQRGQRIGQRRFIGRVGDRDDRALPGQPTGRGDSAAEVPQAHDRRPPSAIVHQSNRTLGDRVDKACWPPAQRGVIMPVWVIVHTPDRERR